jgi:hypothetical protein
LFKMRFSPSAGQICSGAHDVPPPNSKVQTPEGPVPIRPMGTKL